MNNNTEEDVVENANESMILEEEIDENYEPTEEEVIEYAKYLGMNLNTDKKYFHIAREGLKAPLPEPWKPYRNSQGEIYFINLETEEQVFEHPCDQYYKQLFSETKARENNMESPKEMFKGLSFNQAPVAKQKKRPKQEEPEQHEMINDSFSNNSANSTSNNMPTVKEIKMPEAVLTSSLLQAQENNKLEYSMPKDRLDNNLDEDQKRIDEELTGKERQYQKSKNKEAIDKQKSLEKKRKEIEQKLRKEIDEDLTLLKTEYDQQQQNFKTSTSLKKEEIKENLKIKNEAFIDAEVEKLQRDHEKALEEAAEKEQKEVESKIKDFEKEFNENLERKKEELDSKRQNNIKEQEKKQKSREDKQAHLNTKLEDAKRQIDRDFKRKLDAFEKEARSKITVDQNKKLKHMDADLEQLRLSKMDEERDRISDILQRKKDLMELYNKKYELERITYSEKLEVTVEEFEKEQQIKKEEELKKYEDEKLREELRKLSQKNSREREQLLADHKRELDNISYNLSKKYDEQKKSMIIEKKLDTTTSISFYEKSMIEDQEIQYKLQIEGKKRALNMLATKNRLMKQAILDPNGDRPKAKSKSPWSRKELDFINKNVKDRRELFENIQNAKSKADNSVLSKNDYSGFMLSQENISKVMKEVEDLKKIVTSQGNQSFFRPKNGREPGPSSYGLINNKQLEEKKRKWLEIILAEKNKLAVFKNNLKDGKIELKKIQDRIERDKMAVKREIGIAKSTNIENDQKRELIIKLKNNIKLQIKSTNEKVFLLRETEFGVKSKEKALKNLESIYKRMETDNVFNPKQLKSFYKIYKNIEVKHSSSLLNASDSGPLNTMENMEIGKENKKESFKIRHNMESSQEIKSMADDDEEQEFIEIRGASLERFDRNEYFKVPLEANINTVREKERWLHTSSNIGTHKMMSGDQMGNLPTMDGLEDERDPGAKLLDDLYRRNDFTRHLKSRERMRAVFERQSNWFKDLKNQKRRAKVRVPIEKDGAEQREMIFSPQVLFPPSSD